MKARWLLALAIMIVTVASPIAPAAGEPAGEGIGTDVRFEGNVLVISVNLVVLIRSNLLDSSIQQDLAAQLQAAADYWNRDLAANPYFEGCYTVRIEVVATFVHPVNRDFDAPGHVIRTYGSSDVGTMADGRQLPNMLDPSGLADTTVDYEGPFEHRVDGYWPPWLFQDTAALAHELGHMFGMGDDYARDENGDTRPLEGRDGTLMDSGTAIDPTLAARVGDQVLGAGYGDQLPLCEVWDGTVSSIVTTEGPGGPCGNRIPVTGTAHLVVVADGSVTGTYDVDGCGVSEPHADYTGTVTDAGFSFPDLIVFTNGELLPKVSPTHATATFTNQQGPFTTWVTTWDLTCTRCA